jgi:transcriptional regulator with XRE-family HTH domain
MKKTFFQELMSDHEGRRLYFREDLIFEITEVICRTMQEKGVSKTQLAKLLNVSKSNITQLLSGDHNMRLTSVADLLYALDVKLKVTTERIQVEGILETYAAPTECNWSLIEGPPVPKVEFEVDEEEEVMAQYVQVA